MQDQAYKPNSSPVEVIERVDTTSLPTIIREVNRAIALHILEFATYSNQWKHNFLLTCSGIGKLMEYRPEIKRIRESEYRIPSLSEVVDS